MEKKENHRLIPSLDGLRALSVFFVILGHSTSSWLDKIPFNSSFRNGGQGVAVFFVISGFLITHLLLKELRREGGISLKRFYLRRTFRIFPPFYVYILAVAILNLFGVVHVTTPNLIVAATYTWNYIRQIPDVWILGHSWSLAIEEQFYLLWPMCVAFFSRRANLYIALSVILLSPVSRVLTRIALPSMQGHTNIMLHARLDAIMTGCLLSLLIDMGIWEKFKPYVLHSVSLMAAIIGLLGFDTWADQRWSNVYEPLVGMSLECLFIAVILLNVVFRHETPLAGFLNLKVLRHFGRISYSLYLWQQLFTGPDTRSFPLNLIWIIMCAELSYFIVELPSFRLRDRAEKWLLSSPAPVPGDSVRVAAG